MQQATHQFSNTASKGTRTQSLNSAPKKSKSAQQSFDDVVIDLFAGLTVVAGKDRIGLEITRSSRTLLGCIVLHGALRPIRREVLAEILWPDVPEDASRARLRTAMWRLKTALGDYAAMVCQNADYVWLDRKISERCTHLIFSQGVESLCAKPVETMAKEQFQQLDALIGLYSGPLLEGFDDEWAQAERARYTELYSRALERQIQFYRTQNNHEGIAGAARRLLNHDPYREDIHTLLIGMFATIGQPQKAMRQYKECESALRDDLGIVPARAREALQTLATRMPNDEAKIPELAVVIGALDDSIKHLDRQLTQFYQLMSEFNANFPKPFANSVGRHSVRSHI